MKNQRREAGRPVRFEGTHRGVPGIDLLVSHCHIRFEQGQDDKCDLGIATQGPFHRADHRLRDDLFRSG